MFGKIILVIFVILTILSIIAVFAGGGTFFIFISALLVVADVLVYKVFDINFD